MNNTLVDKKMVDSIKEMLNAGERLGGRIDEVYENNAGKLTLWGLFREIIVKTSERQFKSEIHKRNRLSQLSNMLLNYALIESA